MFDLEWPPNNRRPAASRTPQAQTAEEDCDDLAKIPFHKLSYDHHIGRGEENQGDGWKLNGRNDLDVLLLPLEISGNCLRAAFVMSNKPLWPCERPRRFFDPHKTLRSSTH